ncbi:MAG: hypothetical protein IPN33_24700 [Saprospiraceae bacterium]|nr:hypothetical protein [Saprospiraceae bacterium]
MTITTGAFFFQAQSGSHDITTEGQNLGSVAFLGIGSTWNFQDAFRVILLTMATERLTPTIIP